MEPTEQPTPNALPAEAQAANALPAEAPAAESLPMEAQAADTDNLSYEQLVEMYDDSMRHLNEGEIVTGKVIAITSNDVVVDVGYKSEGLVPLHEFSSRNAELQVGVGDEVEVLLEQTEGADGHVMLSKVKAERMRIWAQVENSFKEGKVITGRVIDRIKGGLTVDVGLRAFLPGSLVDIKPVKYLESFKGEELEFKVISLDRRRTQHRAVAARGSREGVRQEEGGDPDQVEGRGRGSRVWSRTSPTTASSSTWAASTACSTSRTSPGAGSTIPRSISASATRSGSSCSVSIPKPSVSPWVTSRPPRIPGPWSTRSTRWVRGCGGGSSAWSTTAPSWSWRRASRGWSTSARCRGRRRSCRRPRSSASIRRSRRSCRNSTCSNVASACPCGRSSRTRGRTSRPGSRSARSSRAGCGT